MKLSEVEPGNRFRFVDGLRYNGKYFIKLKPYARVHYTFYYMNTEYEVYGRNEDSEVELING